MASVAELEAGFISDRTARRSRQRKHAEVSSAATVVLSSPPRPAAPAFKLS
jgi:hypothetical protein